MWEIHSKPFRWVQNMIAPGEKKKRRTMYTTASYNLHSRCLFVTKMYYNTIIIITTSLYSSFNKKTITKYIHKTRQGLQREHHADTIIRPWNHDTVFAVPINGCLNSPVNMFHCVINIGLTDLFAVKFDFFNTVFLVKIALPDIMGCKHA